MNAKKSQLRVGICGMGLMGRGYYRIIREITGATVTAICDNEESRRQPDWYAAKNEGTSSGNDDDSILKLGGQDFSGDDEVATPYADYRDLVADPNLDVVAVTLPSALHADVSIAALENGKHVICEKPMALSAKDCDRMIDAAEKADKILIVDQCVRFFPQYELIKRYVDEGLIGPLKFVSLQRLSSPPTHSCKNWMLDHTISGGGIYDLHIHDVDFVQYMLGLPETIFARGSVGPSGGIDHATATYTYANGTYAMIEGGWAFHSPWPFDMAITAHGETGTLQWIGSQGSKVKFFNGGDEMQELTCPDGGGTRWLINYFIECVQKGRSASRCTPESSRDSVALAQLEHRSILEGTTVDCDIVSSVTSS